MKIFDSIKNKKWVGKGMNIHESSILVLKSANFSHPVPINAGKYNLKIIGRKRTGSGKVKIEVLTGKNDVLFRETIEFAKNSWSEKTFSFESIRNVGMASIKISRERSVYGSIEIGRVFIELVSEKKPSGTAIKHRRIVEVPSKKLNKKLFTINESLMVSEAKVAIIIPYHIYGGAEVYLENIIKHMPDNYKIELLYLKANPLQNKINSDNVSHRVLKNTIQITGILEANNYDFIIYYNRADIYHQLVKIKKEGKIRGKLVEIYHSDFIWSGSLSSVKSREHLDKLIVISSSLGKDISGVKNRDVVRVGIDTDKFQQRENSKLKESLGIDKFKTVIGTVARLSKEKNIDYILNLAKSLDSFHFVVVGDGPERDRLQKRIDSEKIVNARLVGHQRDVSKFYNIFDGFVLASRIEGTPISILESMSSEVPVFTNMVGAIPDIIVDGKTGIRITGDPLEDSEIIPNNIHDLEIIAEARKFVVKNHNVKKTTKAFIASVFSINNLFEKNQKAESLILKGEYV